MLIRKRKYNFQDISQTLTFILSPILSIPLVIKGVYEKRNSSIYCLILLMGIMSYLFVPSIENDKAQYYLFYEKFQSMDFRAFSGFLAIRPDFVFYVLIYVFAQLNLPFEFFFLMMTVSTVSIFFQFFFQFDFKDQVSEKHYLLLVLGFFCSFALPALLSGVRFFLAIAFVILSFHKIFLENKKLWGYISLLIAVSIHFSCLVYIPVIIALKLFPNTKKWQKGFFLLSFIFVLIPKHFFVSFMPLLQSSKGFQEKAVYLSGNDFLSNNLQSGNSNNFILYLVSTFWVFIGYLYIFFTFKRNGILRNFLLLIFGISNIFVQFPTIYDRYILIVNVVLLVSMYLDFTKKAISFKMVRFLIAVFFLSFLLNIYAMRSQLLTSFNDLHTGSLITIFMKGRLEEQDFIK